MGSCPFNIGRDALFGYTGWTKEMQATYQVPEPLGRINFLEFGGRPI